MEGKSTGSTIEKTCNKVNCFSLLLFTKQRFCGLSFLQALEKCQLKATISSLPNLLDSCGVLNL